MPELIYCADGNRRFADIAMSHGYSYGSRLPATVYHPPVFADQEFKKPNRAAYMAALAEHKPRIATVLDLERPEQYDEVIDWANEAAPYVETVVIIPKYDGAISQLPREVQGRPVRLGFSVPTSYGGTKVDTSEFSGWPVHLLGGHPAEQIRLASHMAVVSADTNYHHKIAFKGEVFLNRWRRYRIPLSQMGILDKEDAAYLAFRISCVNTRAAWNHCPAWIRPGLAEQVGSVKRIANQYKAELGFVNSAALMESIERGGLWVACVGQTVVGFVNFRTRRDGISAVYEIAVDRAWHGKGVGTALLETVPAPRRLKCTVDNPANGFYARSMEMVGQEPGRKRQLNVWAKGVLP